MSDLSRKLNRYRDHLVGPAPPDTSSSERAVYQPPKHYDDLAACLAGHLMRTESGAFCKVTTNYSPQYLHGGISLSEFAKHSSWPLSAFTAQHTDERLSARSLVFVDTETTGLGGVGAVAFLVGIGKITPDGFEVSQYVIPDYSDEAAMLEEISQAFTNQRTIVTYNGAAFDMPLLRDRMIVNRICRDIAMEGHIDLLHPVRRLYRRRLGDCTLTNIERELFEFHRRDDIPGYLVPSVYFDWLSERCLDDMAAVLEHNRLDIISLYFLCGILATVFDSEGELLHEVDDIHSLSRLYGRRRQFRRVSGLFRRLDTVENTPLSADVVLYHAYNFKRQGDWPEAVRLWQSLADSEGREAYWSNIELAKYFEHRERDWERARRCAETAARISLYGESHHRHLNRRLERLKRKLNS